MEVKQEQTQEIKEVKEEDKLGVKYINEQPQKFSKFEADYRQQLMAKYFSDKNVFAGNIFDVKVDIDGQTATASRLPPFQSYLNPAVFPQSLRKDWTFSAETSMIVDSE